MKRSYLLIFAILLMAFSIFLIIGSSGKNPLARTTLTFPELIHLTSGETFSISPYEVTVNQPSPLIMGTISHIYTIIHPLGASTNKYYPSITEGFQVDVESKLEITKAQIAPTGLIHTSLKTDQDSDFTWNITTDQSTSLSGTLWIYLAVQPKTSSTDVEELPLFAIPLDIRVATVFGLRADLALVLGIFGSLFALAVIIVALYLNLFKQKKKRQNDIIR
jgi:hypothetical protein